jgi:hypothetical protein
MNNQLLSFISKTEKDLYNVIETNKKRFPSWTKLLERHKKASSRLLKNEPASLNSFKEIHNELCTAIVILEDRTDHSVISIDYEPSLDHCDKYFDFVANMSNGSVYWLEVKTIHPMSKNDWKKYQEALEKERFPKDTLLILSEEWLGGELYHNAYASRSKMMDYTLEMEQKIDKCLVETTGSNMTFLVLYTNGFYWHIDELEDFIYFYRLDKHFPGDPFANMEDHAVQMQGITFKKNIDHFSYIRRATTEIRPNRVVWCVQLPKYPVLVKT